MVKLVREYDVQLPLKCLQFMYYINRVCGESILKPLREADRVLGSESANGTYPAWSAICQ